VEEAYGKIVAAHYAAYRPPLHETILARALPTGMRWSVGADLGCGTGRSAVALSEYCDQVFAIDPSPAMLEAAMQHNSVRYLRGSCEKTDLADRSIDLVTLAGSLFYADRRRAAMEVCRICKSEARIVVYDFEVHLGPWLTLLDLKIPISDLAYDHRVNFQGIDELKQLSLNEQLESIDVTPTQLAHIVLSDVSRLKMLACRFGHEDPLTELARELGNVGGTLQIEAKTFWSVY
jgi:SAM-dependent methyltransferase